MTSDRAAFAALQDAMTDAWDAGVRARHGDPAAYYALRQAAYLDRWREALRFVPHGARLLDIGGGNPFDGLWRLIAEHGLDYRLLDISPGAVEAWRAMASARRGDPGRYTVGFNDRLDFPDASFDAVFSSHCIEHSIDLDATMRELRRVLRPGGALLIAVPLGWEANPAHPYFFDDAEWAGLLLGHGFRIRAVQTACEYPEGGHYDLFIAAERTTSEPLHPKIDPRRHLKASYRFEPPASPVFQLTGDWHVGDEFAIGKNASARLTLRPPPGSREALLVFVRHSWSCIARAEWAGRTLTADLFDWRPAITHPLRLESAEPTDAPIHVEVAGRNPSSQGEELVLVGAMLEKQ